MVCPWAHASSQVSAPDSAAGGAACGCALQRRRSAVAGGALEVEMGEMGRELEEGGWLTRTAGCQMCRLKSGCVAGLEASAGAEDMSAMPMPRRVGGA